MSPAGEKGPPEPRAGAARLADRALAVAAAIVLASWILLAAAHVDDRYAISHVSGAWMALAQQAAAGTVYPPLFDSGFYGGTRYMPLQIELHAGISKLTGEYLASGKLIAYGATLLPLGLVCGALRRFGLPRPHALALTAAVLVTQVGLLAATSIYGDILPALLQVAALLVALRRLGHGGAAAAGLLCGLALLAKVSALWAPLAIGLWPPRARPSAMDGAARPAARAPRVRRRRPAAHPRHQRLLVEDEPLRGARDPGRRRRLPLRAASRRLLALHAEAASALADGPTHVLNG